MSLFELFVLVACFGLLFAVYQLGGFLLLIPAAAALCFAADAHARFLRGGR